LVAPVVVVVVEAIVRAAVTAVAKVAVKAAVEAAVEAAAEAAVGAAITAAVTVVVVAAAVAVAIVVASGRWFSLPEAPLLLEATFCVVVALLVTADSLSARALAIGLLCQGLDAAWQAIRNPIKRSVHGPNWEWMGDIQSCNGLKGDARKVQRSPGWDE
jgi:hypothetical protein